MIRTTTRWTGRRPLALVAAATLALTASACGDDDDDAEPAPTTEAPADDPTDEPDEPTDEPDDGDEPANGDDGDGDELISAERCEANQAAGTITWVSGFDYAAAAGQIEVIVASAEGYFDDYCLDVELQPGFAPANSSIVASGQAQVGIAGDMGDVIATNEEGGDLVAVAQYGFAGVEALVASADSGITSLEDVAGSLVGVKGDIPDSILAMLATNGVERSDFDELLLDGFDPVAHFDLGIDATPVYKSNEPNQLEAAGFDFVIFDPLDYDIPASYGVVFMNGDFVSSHPTAAQDFMRASLRGFESAVADPEAALDAAFELIDAAGNQLFLARDAEAFRWATESQLVLDNAPSNVGELSPERTGEEFALLVDVGLLDAVPEYEDVLAPDIVGELYDDAGELIVAAG